MEAEDEAQAEQKALVPPEPQPESASAVQKKRRKRKKKGPKTDTVAPGSNGNATREKPKVQAKPSKSPYVTSLESQYPISLQLSETRGRHFVATRKIKAGEAVFKEKPYALSPTDIESFGSTCYHCLAEITSKSDSNLKCPMCPMFYCSQKCKETSQPLHDLECPLFTSIKIFSSKSRVEGYKLLLTLRTLLQRQLEIQSTKQGRSRSPLYDLIVSLETHRKEHEETAANAEHLKHLNEAAAFLLDLLKKDTKYTPIHNVSVDQIVDILLIIKVNAIGLKGSNNPAGGGPGLGLFAGACLFNHGCIENVSHTYLTPENGGNNELVLFAVADNIEPGTEIVFSYLDDPYQSTQVRQESLLQTKFFLCSCPRCVDPTEGGRFLRGAACFACREQQNAKGKKGKGKSPAPEGEGGYLVPLPLAASSVAEIQAKVEQEEKLELRQSADWVCSKCKKVYPAKEHKAKDLYKIEKDAQACVEQALYMLQVSQLLTPIVQDSGPEEFKRAISVLEEVLKNQHEEWHPNHHVLFLAKLNLLGCYLQPGVNDLRRCLELSEQICSSAEAVFPTYSVTKAELLGDKANVLQRLAATTKSATLQKRYLEKGREALTAALKNLKACRGEQHFLTKQAENALHSYGQA